MAAPVDDSARPTPDDPHGQAGASAPLQVAFTHASVDDPDFFDFAASNRLAAALRDQLLEAWGGAPGTVLIAGATAAGLTLQGRLRADGLGPDVVTLADPSRSAGYPAPVSAWEPAVSKRVDYLVIAVDDTKEEMLRAFAAARASGLPFPRVVISGTGHLRFRDPLYDHLDRPALLRSYAGGYPNTRIHMFQHLQAAAARGLTGAIVEFGTFKGGTAAWLARTAAELGLRGPVVTFDSWEGIPARRSVFDMYEHPRCLFTDLTGVRRQLEPLGVELVVGDICETAASRLADTPVLFAFIDTDNYTPAAAALEVISDNVVPGGAIVFDHFTTTPEYAYTLGERMAARGPRRRPAAASISSRSRTARQGPRT